MHQQREWLCICHCRRCLWVCEWQPHSQLYGTHRAVGHRCMPILVHWTTALPISLLRHLPTLMGQTPGHLSRAIKRTRASSPAGSTNSMHSLLHRSAIALHRSFEARLNNKQSLFQPQASSPDGPTDPLICWMVCQITSAEIAAKATGWFMLDLAGPSYRASALRGWRSGCLSCKWSLVDLPSGCSSDSSSGLPLPCSVMSLIAVLMLPTETSLSKVFAIFTVSLSLCCLVRHPWIVQPSCNSSSIASDCHFVNLSPRGFEWSLQYI